MGPLPPVVLLPTTATTTSTSSSGSSSSSSSSLPPQSQSCRASAKQKVADSWATRRKNSNLQSSSHKSKYGSSALESNTNHGSPPPNQDKNDNEDDDDRHKTEQQSVCQVVKSAWDQLALFSRRRRLQQQQQQHQLYPRGASGTSSNNSTSSTSQQRVSIFPSVLSILQASAVSSQVVESLQAEQQQTTSFDNENDSAELTNMALVCDILPSSYNWQTAIQSTALSRHRAFCLLDLSAVCKSYVMLQHAFGGCSAMVSLDYRVQHNRDAKLLQLLCRLGVGLRINSSVDVQAAECAIVQQEQQQRQQQQTMPADDVSSTIDTDNASSAGVRGRTSSGAETTRIVDDTSTTRKPNGYLRRLFSSPYTTKCVTVDGPDEVKRICDTHDRLQQRAAAAAAAVSTAASLVRHAEQPVDGEQQQRGFLCDEISGQTHSSRSALSFCLRLPDDINEWEALVQSTQQTCGETNTALVGISLELMDNSEEYLHNIRESIDAIAPLVILPNDDDDEQKKNERALLQIEITGPAVTLDIGPFLTALARSSSSYKVTVDASTLLVAHAGALCTRIIGVKEVGDVRHLYIDDGCYGSLYRDWNNDKAVANKEDAHTPLPLLTASNAETQVTTVWGPTCDGLDRVCRNVILPKLEIDEWLVFPNMGLASGMGTAFNGFDPPDTAYCVLGYFRQQL